jgi:hypothetical protein
MRAGAVRARVAPDVRRVRSNREPVRRERVLDADPEREWVPGLREERVLEHDPVRLVLHDRPPGPAHEAVDRVAVLGLGQRELVSAAFELVLAVAQTIRPRDEQLSAS